MANVTINMVDNFMSDSDIIVDITTNVPSLSYEIVGFDGAVVFGGAVSTISNKIELNLKGLFTPLMNDYYFNSYVIKIYDGNSKVAEKEFSVFKGRMASEILGDKNLFEDFLFNKKANFLFTNRSFGDVIFVPETELLPFFFHSIAIGDLEIKSENDSGYILLAPLGVIDIAQHRKDFFNNTGKLDSVFRVLEAATNSVAFFIVITKAPATRYKIKFKNAFSFFELLALDDYLKFDITTTNNEAIRYSIEDKKSLPIEYNKKAKLVVYASVSNRKDDFAFLSDMLLSTEYFLLFEEEEYPVKVSLEQPFSIVTDTKVDVLKLKIEFLKPLNLNDFLTMPQKGIFTEAFDAIFN